MIHWSYWKTKSKVIFIVTMSLLVLILIFQVIIPVVKWNMSYDISDIDTPEKAIEYYFDAVSEKNPKKQEAVYPSRDPSMLRPGVFEYAFSTLLSCDIKSIERSPYGYENYDNVYYVTYDTSFLFGIPINAGRFTAGQMYFRIIKDVYNGNYYIYETWDFDY